MFNQLSKRIKLGCVSYINAFPFSLKLAQREDVVLSLAPPAKLLQNLIKRELEFALTSSFGLLSHPLKFLPSFGISAFQKILSVNLYASSQFFSLNQPRIAVTNESYSSICLLKILCKHLWEIPSPQFIPLSSQQIIEQSPLYDGLLLIGDQALRYHSIRNFTTYDLAEQWYQLTHLPFVFALVLYQDSLNNEILLQRLDETLIQFEQNPNETVSQAAQHSFLPENLIQEYYSLCRYRLNDLDYAGLEKFREYYATV